MVFAAPEGGVLRVSNWRRQLFNKAVRHLVAADPTFPVVTAYDLRRTANSLSISAGANVKAVQTMPWHAAAVLTLDTYADPFPDDLELVWAALDDARTRSLESAAD
ncbi:hypothetical protein [Mycolicibacterium sp. OfavD-34-C]|uniref:hypothetical protein n=1 Tax=Mycolicibacterium sp. OfavD-34-C TaxID=2917746 RepID=UPI001EF4D50D|nr:hypothetical protein [Mycolicibacterium sp. OfavD-34-C]MCG7581421.1 hypothetical protein [Mycolicibacterium sp. OfavD-34-C]